MNIPYVKQDGTVNGINFDGRFSVKGYRGIAFYLLGFSATEQDPQFEGDDVELIKDENNVVAVMVGDDRKHVVPIGHLTEIAEDSYCPSCGQIGCRCGRL
jgi:hypothetical protein